MHRSWTLAAAASSRLTFGAPRMQTGFAEVTYTDKPLPILNRHQPVMSADDSLVAKALEHAVDVDGGEPGRIGKLLLRHEEVIDMHLVLARCLEANRKLAQQVRTRVRASRRPTLAIHPREIDRQQACQAALPARLPVRVGDIPGRRCRDQGDIACGRHLHIVICNAGKEF
jgi:hypothetical protein